MISKGPKRRQGGGTGTFWPLPANGRWWSGPWLKKKFKARAFGRGGRLRLAGEGHILLAHEAITRTNVTMTTSTKPISDPQLTALIRHVVARLADLAPPTDGARKSVAMSRWETQRRFGIDHWGKDQVRQPARAAHQSFTVKPCYLEEDGGASDLQFMALPSED